MGDCVREIRRAEFETEVLRYDGLVLVDFYSDNCQPCLMLAPTLEKFCAARNGEVKTVKINVTNCVDLARRYELMGVPSLLLFRGGAPLGSRTGLISRQELDRWLDETLAGSDRNAPLNS